MQRIEELSKKGRRALLLGRFEESQWALNAALYLKSSAVSVLEDPTLWERGLSCYYGGHFKEGALQFQSDMIENGSDVEEIIWNFLCQCSNSSLAEAKLPDLATAAASEAPPIPPMGAVLNLFKGTGSCEDVMESATPKLADSVQVVKSYNDTNALAYAHFYIGLYEELHGRLESVRHHFQAASGLKNPDYMGSIMAMHFSLFSLKYPLWYSTIQWPVTGPFPKIIHGGWQLSRGHVVNQTSSRCTLETVRDLLEVYDSGIRAFDCGDIYTGVEELYGMLIRAHCNRGGRREDIAIHTKLVPDLDAIRGNSVNERYVKSVLRRSLNRLGVQTIDLVQFHWWDTSVPGAVQALKQLHHFVGKGWVKRIGLTNFDMTTTKTFLDENIPIDSTQVQFSILDRRPLLSGLVELCAQHNIGILAYGVLAGGFLTDAWLGKEKPSVEDLDNRSLVKYLLIIEEFGGWLLFQRLLEVLRTIADRHGSMQIHGCEHSLPVCIAMVAISYVLRQDQVKSIIVGSHSNRHLYATMCTCDLELSMMDLADIERVLGCSKGPNGGVYHLERDSYHHAAIMKYNLNQVNGALHLEELCCRYLQLHFEGHPVEATRTGYRQPKPVTFNLELPQPSEEDDFYFDYKRTFLASLRSTNYDHLYGPCSEEDILDYCRKIRLLLDEAESIERLSLTPDQLVDLELIISSLRFVLLEWNEIQSYKKDPLFYLPLNSILYLLPIWGPEDLGPEMKNHPGAASLSADERLLALLSRLRNIPNALIQAQRNLTKPVRHFVETALEICDSFASFLSSSLPILARASQQDTIHTFLLGAIDSAAMVAADCIGNYKSFLKDYLLPISDQLPGLGKELYEKVLQYGYFIESSSKLLELGEKHFHKVKNELESLAAEIDEKIMWKEVTKDLIQVMHPTAKGLLDSYMTEISRCREHMISHNLVTRLPGNEKVVGFWTPSFLTPFSPVGDYLNPSPFAGMAQSEDNNAFTRVGHLMLHSIEDRKLPEEEEENLLRGHDYTWISVVCPHESYPGHHIQALQAQSHPRILRQYYESTVFYEGWGLYTEQLAYETGFFEKELTYTSNTNPKTVTIPASEFAKYTRLTQLRLQLWRSARIILDVKLNIGEFTAEDCSDFLQREVMFNSGAVKGEVFMYMSRPGYASCYITGFVEIMELREKLRKKLGTDFNLKHFHDSLLEKGCIPFQLMSRLLN